MTVAAGVKHTQTYTDAGMYTDISRHVELNTACQVSQRFVGVLVLECVSACLGVYVLCTLSRLSFYHEGGY